jgi:tetratricopeptide (TPR) repeat protein
MNFKFIFLIISLVISKLTFGQITTRTDTIEIARNLSYQKKFQEAANLLKEYEIRHPKSINSVRLHAQILYWTQDFDGALDLLSRSMEINPNPYVQLDYGRMLFDINRLDESKKIMEDYLRKDKENLEALNTLGTIAYWQGEPTKAKAYFNNVLKQYPKNEQAIKYIAEINHLTRPYINLLGGYGNDTQPINVLAGQIETGWYQSKCLSPKLTLQTKSYDINNIQNSFHGLELGNKLSLTALKLDILMSGGIYKSPVENSNGWTGKLELNKKLSSIFSLSASAQHQPYFYTISSLQKEVTFDNYGLALVLNKPNSYMGWAGYNLQQFMDQNRITSYGAWLLLPPIKLSKLNLALGYSFNYANADQDYFISITPLSEAIVTKKVNGVYDPYFTPINQIENSVLANLQFKPSEAFNFSVNSRFGFYAIADRPGYVLNSGVRNQTSITKAFNSEKFTPVEINAAIDFKISKKTTLHANYSYLETYFYNNNLASLGLNIKL